MHGLRHDFLGAVGGEFIECFVQVHHQAVHAVRSGLRHASQLGDLAWYDIRQRCQPVPQLQLGYALGRSVALRRRTRLDRGDHGAQVRQHCLSELTQVGGHATVRSELGAIDQALDPSRGETRGVTLHGKIGSRALRIAGVLASRLQRGHAHLDPIVRGKPFGHQRR